MSSVTTDPTLTNNSGGAVTTIVRLPVVVRADAGGGRHVRPIDPLTGEEILGLNPPV